MASDANDFSGAPRKLRHSVLGFGDITECFH